MPSFVEIVVTLPIEGRFHYAVPAALEGQLRVGHRVLVPFGPRKITGFVVAENSQPPKDLGVEIRPILARLDEEPLLTPDLMTIVTFAAEYYLAPVGEVLRVAMPPGVTAGSVARLRATKAGRDALAAATWVDPEGRPLSEKEREALEAAARSGGVRREKVSKAARDRLLALGLLGERDHVATKDTRPVEIEVLELTAAASEPEGAFLLVKKCARSAARRQLVELLKAGPKTREELAGLLGAAELRAAVAPLEKAGLLNRRRVSAEEAAALAPAASGSDPAAPARRGPPVLTSEQRAALEAISKPIAEHAHAAFLLRGVTGSGKTEVYLHAIQQARALGRSAIVLVPEIALTAQLEMRFRERFGEDVVVLHSALSDNERRKNWERLRSASANIALGPRSAVWAPVQNLGVVVVDEEHDASFKQQNELRYNGRDLALVRAHRAGGVAIFGSATPSLETRQLAESGRMKELRLGERVGGRPMPEVAVVDLAAAQREHGGGEIPILSRLLGDQLRAVIERKEQAILFLNRRGFNTVVVCEDCGQIRTCPSCDVSLTHHKAAAALICHYCGYRDTMSSPCGRCRSTSLKPYGTGTERVAEAVKEVAPDARVLRLDRDTSQKAGALHDTLERFRSGRADVLVGTQMVAKGHDFPNVTLVGVICADTSLAFPDFRAAERTFQLLTQVAGRAGRADLVGRVVIQTFQPAHYSLTCAIEHDDQRFFELECESRRSAGYPPFARLGLVRVESTDGEEAGRLVRALADLAHRAASSVEGLVVRGPVPAPIERIRGRWRYVLMLRAPTPARLVQAMRWVREHAPEHPRRVDVIYDVDAVDLL